MKRIVPLLLFTLTTCAPGTDQTAPSSPPPVGATEAPTASTALPAGSEGAVAAVKADLAARQTINGEAIKVANIERVEWSDASLGCPAPDQAYAQVVTPGFRVLLQVHDEVYEYHTDEAGEFVLCQGGRPATSGSQREIQNPDDYY